MRLTDNEKTQLQRRGPGHHYFACCPLCGHTDWQSTNTAAEDGVTMHEDQGGNCYRCAEVAQRNPELFQWILAVFGYQERRKRQEATQP